MNGDGLEYRYPAKTKDNVTLVRKDSLSNHLKPTTNLTFHNTRKRMVIYTCTNQLHQLRLQPINTEPKKHTTPSTFSRTLITKWTTTQHTRTSHQQGTRQIRIPAPRKDGLFAAKRKEKEGSLRDASSLFAAVGYVRNAVFNHEFMEIYVVD